MAPPITRTSTWNSSDYSCIIDVRAPSEFAEDHVPGAINLPVLDDAERAQTEKRWLFFRQNTKCPHSLV